MVKIAPAEDLNLLPESKKFMRKYYPAASPSTNSLTLQKLIGKRFLDFLDIFHRRHSDVRVHALGCSASL
ncbi:MAG: hypothetical protein ACTSYU_07470, partial [Promethearchaeota archaeon]